MAPEDPDPVRFLIAGAVSAWDPRTRLLQISGQELRVGPEVSLAGLDIGNKITVSGHEEPSGRRVVARVTVG